MEKKFEVLPPTMPNFVRFKHEAALKQDGFKINDGFPVSEFTKEEAIDFANLMYDTFLKHWEDKVSLKEK